MAGGTTKVVLSAIGGNGFITITKGIGWFLTGSPSMLAETIHSAADTANQFLIFIGIKHSEKGPTSGFPVGQASARYLWNLVSAMGIFFIGFGVTLYHGIHSLLHPPAELPNQIDWIPVGILLMALLIEGAVFLVAWKEVAKSKGKRGFVEFMRTSDDPTAAAILLEDGIAVFGVCLALTGIGCSFYFNSHLPDAIASIVIAVLLGVMAVILAMANGRLLIGVSAETNIQKEVHKLIESHPSVEKVENLVTRVIGPGLVRLGCEVEFHGSVILDRKQLDASAAKIKSGADPLPELVDASRRMVRLIGREINGLENKIREEFPQVVYIDIEVN